MTTQMIIRLDSDTKTKLAKLAKAEGKNTSQVIRKLIEDYIQDRDMGNYIDDLWKRVGIKFKSRGINSAEIKRAIREVRASEK